MRKLKKKIVYFKVRYQNGLNYFLKNEKAQHLQEKYKFTSLFTSIEI